MGKKNGGLSEVGLVGERDSHCLTTMSYHLCMRLRV